MSCPSCWENYDDHTDNLNCMAICAASHTVCRGCMSTVQASTTPNCPICRRELHANPLFIRINNEAPAPAAAAPVPIPAPVSDKIVMLVDVSGSMGTTSGDLAGAPTRLELAVHMVKVMIGFCRKLGIKFVIYKFSEAVTQLNIDETTSVEQANLVLEKIEPEAQTFIGLALKRIFDINGAAAKYFVFTDGEPTDQFAYSVQEYVNTQLHLLAFGKDISTDLLIKVGNNPLHTISYIKDIQSLPGYMVPTFIWAMTDMQHVTLNARDEELRTQFIQMLEPQVRGSSSQYTLFDLVNLVSQYNARNGTDYSRDLAMDIAGTPAHSRIEYSFQKANWNNFGRFYLLCITQCHKYCIPGNSFDPSLKHYRTEAYQRVFEQIADIPISIPFVAFTARGADRVRASAAAATVVQRSFSYVDSYTSSSSDDGCIGADAIVEVYKNSICVPTAMKNVRPGDVLGGSKVAWIIRIHGSNNGKPLTLYNGLTDLHPVRDTTGRWIAAKNYQNALITKTTGVVYDVILEDRTVASMTVNGIEAAVVGYPVPGMVHPYWGSDKAVDEIRSRYPNGGFVDVDASHFQRGKDGLVTSLFAK